MLYQGWNMVKGCDISKIFYIFIFEMAFSNLCGTRKGIISKKNLNN